MKFLRSRSRRQLLRAGGALLVTLGAMLLLYCGEFTVSLDDKAGMEAAIDAYFFTLSVDANILEIDRAGNTDVIFFERQGYPGHHGTAYLERGLFGRGRFTSASLGNWPLYGCRVKTIGDKNFLIVSGLYDLPADVQSWAVYPGTSIVPLWQDGTQDAPFQEVIELEDAAAYTWLDATDVHYYGADGQELNAQEIAASLPQAVSGNCPSVGTAELGVIYMLLALTAIIGLAVMWLLLLF